MSKKPLKYVLYLEQPDRGIHIQKRFPKKIKEAPKFEEIFKSYQKCAGKEARKH